jgi:hypothetical protein
MYNKILDEVKLCENELNLCKSMQKNIVSMSKHHGKEKRKKERLASS